MKSNVNFLRNWVVLLGLVLIVIVGWWYWSGLQSPLDLGGHIKAFVINPGDNPTTVAERLEKGGYIKSAWMFKYLYKQSEDQKILPGVYLISSAMRPQEIIDSISRGSVDKRVTILEGWRKEEIAQKLNQELGIKNQEFLENAKEGYMFPDTYFFNPKVTASDIALTMKNNFAKKYSAELRSKIKGLGLTEEQGVILASLVEREARSDKVRQQVASVILKRLKMGMKLDIDATVQYAKDSEALVNGNGVNKFWLPVSQQDYSGVDHPYNTYLNPGLPPGPIASPSLSSLNAAASADSTTPYLFYYHDSKGNTYLARTLEEHNANVANYR